MLKLLASPPPPLSPQLGFANWHRWASDVCWVQCMHRSPCPPDQIRFGLRQYKNRLAHLGKAAVNTAHVWIDLWPAAPEACTATTSKGQSTCPVSYVCVPVSTYCCITAVGERNHVDDAEAVFLAATALVGAAWIREFASVSFWLLLSSVHT